MRVWIDLTNSPHVLVMRPVIELLERDGHEVRVTARDFAQTIELCQRMDIDHTAIGHHRGERLTAKAIGLAARSAALVRWAIRERHAANGRGFDIALGHGSNDISVAAALMRVPSATMFDYEWATIQHNVNCRLARAVVVPAAIPPERLDVRQRIAPHKIRALV
jgi:predicted glycosyltransferase